MFYHVGTELFIHMFYTFLLNKTYKFKTRVENSILFYNFYNFTIHLYKYRRGQQKKILQILLIYYNICNIYFLHLS